MSLPGFNADESLGKNIGQYCNMGGGFRAEVSVNVAGLVPSFGGKFGIRPPGDGPVGLTGVCRCAPFTDICVCFPSWADDFIIIPWWL